MKNFTLLLLFLLAGAIFATGQVNSLNENFDASCPTFDAFPGAWFEYNNVGGTIPGGQWRCAPLNGYNNTPGMDCTGYFNGVFNVDTSFLISPQLNLSSYVGQHVYLRFDSKTSQLTQAGNLSVIASNSSSTSTFPGPETFLTYLDLTANMSPLISNDDSSRWVTHEIDLTELENAGNFFIAFRYGSTTSTGSIWFLDNIITSTSSILDVPAMTTGRLALKVLGYASSTEITIEYTCPETGNYSLSVFDMLGREVYKENKKNECGQAIYTINNLNLVKGLYLIKMSSGNTYDVTKVIIP